MAIVQEAVLPWYEKHSGEAVSVAQISLKDEVARKCLESLAGVVWKHRDAEANPDNKFFVADVEAEVENGDYTLVITLVLDADDVDPEKVPLHVFLCSFEPVGEIKQAEYNA
jgi:hypothetical protein